MDDETLAREFDDRRQHLTSVAFQIVGFMPDAEDVVQNAWLKIAASDASEVRNRVGWFTTITTRTALDVLKARQRRREAFAGDDFAHDHNSESADAEVLLADSVSRALVVVLERLSPAERVAFVLHDVFDMPFDEIGAILDRTQAATKKLGSRARAKVRGADLAPAPRLVEHTEIVEAFLGASRGSDIPRLLKLLAPDVVRTVDPTLIPTGGASVVHGAVHVAEETRQFTARADKAAVVLLDGRPGLAIAPSGRLFALIAIAFNSAGLIDRIDITADRRRMDAVSLSLPVQMF